jgi:hypothetical protein
MVNYCLESFVEKQKAFSDQTNSTNLEISETLECFTLVALKKHFCNRGNMIIIKVPNYNNKFLIAVSNP